MRDPEQSMPDEARLKLSTKYGPVATPKSAGGSRPRPKRRGKSIHLQLPDDLAKRLAELALLGRTTQTAVIVMALRRVTGDKRIAGLINELTGKREQEETVRLVATLAAILENIEAMREQIHASTGAGIGHNGARLVVLESLNDIRGRLRALTRFLDERHEVRVAWLRLRAKQADAEGKGTEGWTC